jgi:hypothetical protein
VKIEAMKMCNAASEDFVTELYRKNLAPNGEEFAEVLKKFGVKKEIVGTYQREMPPSVNGVGSVYLIAACDLGDERLYSDPYPATFGSVVLFLERKEAERKLELEEAIATVRNDMVNERMEAEFEGRVNRIRSEVLIAIECGRNVANVFERNGVPYEIYSGISVNNADEKDFDPLYKSVIAHIKQSENVKLTAVDGDEMLIFAVTGRKFKTSDSISQLERSETELKLRNSNKIFLLTDFFSNQIPHPSR